MIKFSKTNINVLLNIQRLGNYLWITEGYLTGEGRAIKKVTSEVNEELLETMFYQFHYQLFFSLSIDKLITENRILNIIYTEMYHILAKGFLIAKYIIDNLGT